MQPREHAMQHVQCTQQQERRAWYAWRSSVNSPRMASKCSTMAVRLYSRPAPHATASASRNGSPDSEHVVHALSEQQQQQQRACHASCVWWGSVRALESAACVATRTSGAARVRRLAPVAVAGAHLAATRGAAVVRAAQQQQERSA